MAAIAVGVIGAAASIFGSSSSAKASKAQAEAQRQAAELQTQVARELHAHWKAYYSACDIAYITEICAIPVYTPQYETVSSRARMTILSAFGRARQQLYKCQDIFCVGKIAQDCNFISGIEAIALADAINYGYRREESLKIQLDQMRIDNQFKALGLGRNLLDQSMKASSVASGVASRTGAQAGSAANGWLQFAGFLNTPEGKKLSSGVSNTFARLYNSSDLGKQLQLDPAAANAATTIDQAGMQATQGTTDPGAATGGGGAAPYDSSNQLFPGTNFATPETFAGGGQ